MPTMTQHAPGTFCWPELGTTDQAGAKAFYTSLFGWTFKDSPMGPDEIYTIFQLDGRDCAAWQAKQHAGVGVLGEPGSLAWTQLNASRSGPAKAFYTRLFGWDSQDSPMPGGGGDYTTFMQGGRPIGGIMPMPADVPEGAPSHWLSYFATSDVDATTAKTASLGGRALVPPTDIPGMGRFAVLQDPRGAVFAIVRFSI